MKLPYVIATLSLAASTQAGIVVFEASGATPAAITPARDAFRVAVGGGTTAAANGDFGGVRREINWDGVPAGSSDPSLLPANFFNTTSPRGVVFSTTGLGTGFLVSGTTPVTELFGFSGDLQTFSPAKLFATVGTNTMDISFFLPGTSTAATTSAFAVIFVDVEDASAANHTRVEFFDANNALIFSRDALATVNRGLSFVGGVADAGERISRVRITMPANFLVSNGVRNNEAVDFVVMDDFLFATPANVPEPSSVSLLTLGLAAAALARRQRR